MSATIFTVKRSEIEGRLDPFFYRPDFMELEKVMKKIDALPLRKFVRGIASGATPKTDEYEKYYSDKENGIPFLRVQNLSPTSILNYADCKYINKETHESMLCRSQVNEGDLLVKITGVGRMAIASVAPRGFVGNTNQHMCVIKTKDEKTSWILASWLNTDIAEKLASRRATGGTRPALDYPALLSIPIIFDERIYDTMKKAVAEMKKKQQQAKELLASIDSYLLSELGITLPKKDNSLSKRIFTTKFSEVTGGRLDAYYNNQYYKDLFEEFKKSEYKLVFFHEIINDIKNGVEIRNYVDNGIRYLRVSDLSENGILNTNARYVETQKIPERIKLNSNSFLISRSGSLGLVNVVTDEVKESILSSHIFKVDLNTEKVFPEFLETFFRSSVGQFQFFRNNNGGVIPEINHEALISLRIILPPLPKQKEIAGHIRSIRAQAKQLQAEAEQILQDAKQQVEKMILGE